MSSDLCPVYSPFFGAMGCVSAIALTALGASYGTAKSGVGVMAVGVLRPDQTVRCLMPILMAGIVAIYGLVISILISYGISSRPTHLATSFSQLGAGLSVGLSGLASGFSIGICGDAGVRATAQQPRLYTAMMLILILPRSLGSMA
ncbi:vacuolar ATPase V0 domain subunit c [Elasticomyces elasticus]|uniref:V-type proton ATPase proteolipid subunit n=1 Tax=Exophiala sideris TaxID=1016849 RepID=A0ABR0JH69_9EURO|nr:vacuolar ATPase V0 domain subunit c [Elasticomyces elasticus]KAK5032981.1 vacuolar ATPase V0 domain subunit c [Exophiala sideris]KAK5063466.1 H(+)-transporting V0 sector ATPase subunit c [Exophiala sideris]KAK5180702.1 H(+)-transporting V0 sector ATPase subunit c [Eurotiomycetes sp. CCFEE 6388]